MLKGTCHSYIVASSRTFFYGNRQSESWTFTKLQQHRKKKTKKLSNYSLMNLVSERKTSQLGNDYFTISSFFHNSAQKLKYIFFLHETYLCVSSSQSRKTKIQNDLFSLTRFIFRCLREWNGVNGNDEKEDLGVNCVCWRLEDRFLLLNGHYWLMISVSLVLFNQIYHFYSIRSKNNEFSHFVSRSSLEIDDRCRRLY